MSIHLAGVISRWFAGSVDEIIASLLSTVFCLATAVACGVIIGSERRADRKSAGIRTHVLVCAGAAAFVHLGVLAVEFGSLNQFGRLIQSIATGIGFLGAAAIFRGEGGVQGITTAASIWMMGAIGAAAGAGAIVLALLMTLITYLVLQWSGDVPLLDEYIKEHDVLGARRTPPEHSGAEDSTSI